MIMKLTVTLNTRTFDREVDVDVGPNNSIPMILAEACRLIGVSYASVTSFLISGAKQ